MCSSRDTLCGAALCTALAFALLNFRKYLRCCPDEVAMVSATLSHLGLEAEEEASDNDA